MFRLVRTCLAAFLCRLVSLVVDLPLQRVRVTLAACWKGCAYFASALADRFAVFIGSGGC